MTKKAFEKIKAGLEDALAMARAERAVLPDGVHLLSDEGFEILRRIKLRDLALTLRHVKRVS